ncbi:MAG: DUF934 domain-containing protein [Alphaproteobacteria bacterium]|jgi:uncharacterized protein (DUF934 family)
MPLIKDRTVVEDGWSHLADDEAVPAEGGVIVSLARWQAERDSLAGRNAPLGIRLKSDERPDAVAADLDRFDVVALEFPAFKDGRAYSSARLLRDRFRYSGELRACGDVLRDQLAFMARCGFDAFEYSGLSAAEDALSAFDDIAAVYQTAADRRRSAAALRNDGSTAFLNGTCG